MAQNPNTFETDNFTPGRIAFYVPVNETSHDNLASFASLLDLFFVWRSYMSRCRPVIHIFPDLDVDVGLVDTCFCQPERAYSTYITHDPGEPMPLSPFEAQPRFGLTHAKMRIIQEGETTVSVAWQGNAARESALEQYGVRSTFAIPIPPRSGHVLYLPHLDVVLEPYKLHDIMNEFGNETFRAFVDESDIEKAVQQWLDLLELTLPCLHFERRQSSSAT